MDNEDLKKEFEKFDVTVSQGILQAYWAKEYKREGLRRVLDLLYEWSLKTGYISEGQLARNKHYRCHDPETNVNFRIQINYARDGYTPDPPNPRLHCPICYENIGEPGREALRVFCFSLAGREFFLQLTPFPLFERHFVLITRDKLPMTMDEQSVRDLMEFIELVPGYTGCSNSDVEWAGASVRAHHHYQVVDGLSLPVAEAAVIPEFFAEQAGLSYGLLDYPLATCLIRHSEREIFARTVGKVISGWKAKDPGRNTCNLVVSREDGYSCYIMFRNPDYRTSPEFIPIKSEGVGVIEAAGEGVFPVPTSQKLWDEVENRGLQVIKGIIGGNNPVARGGFGELFKWIKGTVNS